MNVVLWTPHGLATLRSGAAEVTKVFLFDKASADLPSFGAFPRRV